MNVLSRRRKTNSLHKSSIWSGAGATRITSLLGGLLILRMCALMRDTWLEYFFGIVHAVSVRATCDRGKCATITVKDKHILSTGYVGAPTGLPHCDDVGHLFRTVTHTDGSTKQHCVRTVHAEANAVAQAAKFGISLQDARLYSSMFPCFDCAKLIVAAGITQVYAEFDYPASVDSKALFTAAGLHFVVLNEEVKYDNDRG